MDTSREILTASELSKKEPEALWHLLLNNLGSSSSEQRELIFDALALSASTSSDLIQRELMGSEWLLAIQAASRFPSESLYPLFPGLVYLASWGHGAVGTVRKLIKSMPRGWVLERIEDEAEVFLQSGDDVEYRRFLELYKELEAYDHLQRLALRAAQSENYDIREAGEDFLMLLKQKDRR